MRELFVLWQRVLFFGTIIVSINFSASEPCPTPNGVEGDCTTIQKCPALYKIAEKKPVSSSNMQLLRKSFCGFEGQDPKVCCPPEKDLETRASDPCSVVNGGDGDCVVIQKCPPFYNLATNKPVSSANIDFLKKSHCGFQGEHPKVCCPIEVNVGTRVDARTLLPSHKECGIDAQDRIYGGTEAALSEFPWMALIEYENDSGKKFFNCSGALISKRYVLTAGHCVKLKSSKWKLISVILGEYDIEKEIDCEGTGLTKVCAPHPLNIPIEETIPHEDFARLDNNHYHDIALLRLDRDVPFSLYVQPICLPIIDIKKNFVGEELVVSGWGKTETKLNSNVKLKVNVRVKDSNECKTTYKSKRINISDGQLCAGGEWEKDSCNGDSGSPLMAKYADENNDINWYSIGIVSFGMTPCGSMGWPGVYSSVSNYVEWIESKLKA